MKPVDLADAREVMRALVGGFKIANKNWKNRSALGAEVHWVCLGLLSGCLMDSSGNKCCGLDANKPGWFIVAE